jgi:hypothetical protein
MAFALTVAKYVPPPTIRHEPATAYAHCVDPRCKGNRQEPVAAVKEITEWTFGSRGGGDDPGGMGNMFLNMIENSQTSLNFGDEADRPCPSCGKPRELSGETRPVYPIQVGGANALLRLQEMGVQFDPERQEQITKGAPETPLELLQRRYINDEITDEEFAAKRAALEGGGAPAARVVAEESGAQNERIEAMQAQIDRLLDALGETPAPKRGPGRPRKTEE